MASVHIYRAKQNKKEKRKRKRKRATQRARGKKALPTREGYSPVGNKASQLGSTGGALTGRRHLFGSLCVCVFIGLSFLIMLACFFDDQFLEFQFNVFVFDSEKEWPLLKCCVIMLTVILIHLHLLWEHEEFLFFISLLFCLKCVYFYFCHIWMFNWLIIYINSNHI